MQIDIQKLFDTEEGRAVYQKAVSAISDFQMADSLKRGVLVGLSGGADSIMLLCVLYKYAKENEPFKILAVHVNHGIRGAEADSDQAFSKEFAEALGIEFKSFYRDIPMLAKECKKGLEETARDFRYFTFNDIICGRKDISYICVAHNSTDNLETVIFNIMRGTGLKGLSGIHPTRDNVLRPLIYASSEEIRLALNASGIEYVTDSTNLTTDYSRNYIRHEILPRLNRLSGSPEDSALRMTKIVREDNSFLEKSAKDFLSMYRMPYRIAVSELRSLHPALLSRTISMMVENTSGNIPTYTQITELKELISKDNFRFDLIGEVSFVCERGICFIETKDCDKALPFDVKLNIGVNKIEGYEGMIILSEEPILNSFSNVYKISIQQIINSDIIKGELFVRSKADGDKYVYGGITRKLKKVFNDKNIPPSQRNTVPVIYDDQGIVTVMGLPSRDEEKKEAEKNKLYVAIAYEKAENTDISKIRLHNATDWT